MHAATQFQFSTVTVHAESVGGSTPGVRAYLTLNEFRCYEGKIEESENGRQPPGVEPRAPGLSSQCSATELRQPDNHQPSQSSICTAQVVLNASVAHLAATQYVPSELR